MEMRKSLVTGLIVLSMVFCSGAAMAWDYATFGTNITVYDGNGDGTTSGWHKGVNDGGIYEDGEVETFSGNYSATPGQNWDMEAFFWDTTTNQLTMVGGFDLINGVPSSKPIYRNDGEIEDGSYNIDPGHIFISDGTNRYAIAFNSNGATAYTLTNNSNLLETKYFTGTSSPWMLSVDGETSTSLTATYLDFAGSTDLVGVATGGDDTHNAIQVDLSSLTLGTNFTAHFTMECGNDNLMGRTSQVPIPGAVWLFGSGLLGLVGIRRRRQS